MKKRINLYFFGDIGVYDEYNPAYVYRKKYASEILYLIAKNRPYTISKDEIIKTMDIEEDAFEEVIAALKKINMIDIKDSFYKVNFPVFLEKDLTILDNLLIGIGKYIGEALIKNKQYIYNKLIKLSCNKIFTKKWLLYHIICDYIFDGTAIDYFNERGLFCVSKILPGDRDYIAVGYEDNETVELHSNKLLCSSNNFKSNSFVFNSFGDSNGQRKDMYRFFRIVEQMLENTSKMQDLNLTYIKIIDGNNKEIAEKCGKLILKILNSKIRYIDLDKSEKELSAFLRELNYISYDDDRSVITVAVPVFFESDIKIINEISEFILSEIFETVKELFAEFEKSASELTAIQHDVNIKEILNEIWHQVFGITNEYLVEKEFVAALEHINGEGRYFRSLRVNY